MKLFRLNESTISIILGAIVVIIVGILVANYDKGIDSTPFPQPQPGPAPISEFTEKETCSKYKNSTLEITPNKCLKYFLDGGDK